MDQWFKHFFCNRKIWTEFANGFCAQTLNYGTWDFDGNGEYMDRRSSTIYLRFFLATKMVVPLESAQNAILAKMVVPLESAQNAILALNRKMQFPPFNYGQYFMGAQYDHKQYLHKFS
jgi:hypothetical protein